MPRWLWFIPTLIGLQIVGTLAIAQQQQPDPAFLLQAMQVVQGQRNSALDGMAVCQAQGAMMTEELKKAKERIAMLEKAAEDKKP